MTEARTEQLQSAPHSRTPHNRRRLIGMLAAGMLVTGFFLFLESLALDVRKYMDELNRSMERLLRAIDETADVSEEVHSYVDSRLEARMRFYSGIYETEPGETGIEKINSIIMYENFAILDADGNWIYASFVFPEEKKAAAEEAVAKSSDAAGIKSVTVGSDEFLIGHHPSGTVYVQYVNDAIYRMLMGDHFDLETLVESAFDNHSFAMAVSDHKVIAVPEEYSDLLEADPGSLIQVRITLNDPHYKNIQLVRFHHQYWLMQKAERADSAGQLYYFCSMGYILQQSILLNVLLLAIIFIILSVITFYLYECRKEHDSASPKEKVEYRYRFMILFLVGTMLIALAGFYCRTLFCLSTYVMDDWEEIERLRTESESRKEITQSTYGYYDEMRLQDAQLISMWLQENPEKRTKEELRNLSRWFSLDYLILFDENGNAIVNSEHYVDLKLSDRREDASNEVWALIQGVPFLSLSRTDDDLTGMNHRMIGVSIYGADGNPECVMLASFPEGEFQKQLLENSLFMVLEETSRSAMNQYFAVDGDTGRFTFSPDHTLDGLYAKDYGFTEEVLSPDYTGYLRVNRQKYYLTSARIDNQYVYVALADSIIYNTRARFTLSCALAGGMVLLVLMALVTFLKIPHQDLLSERYVDVVTDLFLEKETVSVRKRWTLLPAKWKELNAEEKTFALLRRYIMVFFTVLAAYIYLGRKMDDPNSIISYIFLGRWKPGFNVFAVTAIILMVLVTVLAVRAVLYGLQLFAEILSARGETVVRLIRSVIRYAAVLLTIYFALASLGLNIRSLVVSAGILTLVIGLGAEDLIADIIAGLSLIFDGAFQVGDIIDINGTIGTVREIGIRSTKIVDSGNNVVIVNNSNVSNVINRTVRSSFMTVTIPLKPSIRIQELEEIFAAELPLLKEQYPQLLSVPFFNGVDQILESRMECLVIAEVMERDRSYMTRQLNREVKRILEAHGYKIGVRRVWYE